MKGDKKVGLSLSGGGYRAATYHIGTIRKLNEMGLLDKIDFISSNSGGSITAAAYCLNVDESYDISKFERVMFSGLRKNLITRIFFSLRFIAAALLCLGVAVLTYYYIDGTAAMIMILIILGFLQYVLFPFSKRNESSYRKFFVDKNTLGDLPKKPMPKLVMNSTNLETGRPFIFASDQMGDSSYSYPADDKMPSIKFNHEKFPIARAVAASTGVPFAFSPVNIAKSFFKNSEYSNLINPRLVDGGVYDNQGTHRLSHPRSRYASDIIIVSDAGNKMPFRNTYRNVLALLIRVSDVFMNRIKNMQMIELLYDSIQSKNRQVAYLSLGWNPHKSVNKFVEALFNGFILEEVWKSHGISQAEIDSKDEEIIKVKLKKSIDYDEIIKGANTAEETDLARSVSTNLTPLSVAKTKALINHAYVFTEMQIRLYCPSLL